jgi:16S rRNA (cytidine1402-2'-O)-methyltransferase
MAGAFGDDRAAAVCRELTKTHEEVRRGPLTDLVAWAAERVRGEVTIVVAGAPDARSVGPTPDDWRTAVAALESDGTPRKAAIAQVAKAAAVPKRLVYDAVHKSSLSPQPPRRAR